MAGQAQRGRETLPTAAEIQDQYGGLNRARQSKLGVRSCESHMAARCDLGDKDTLSGSRLSFPFPKDKSVFGIYLKLHYGSISNLI